MPASCPALIAMLAAAVLLLWAAPRASAGEGAGTITWKPDPRAVESGLYIQPQPAAKKATLAFTVQEPSGVARKRWPVRGGLPLFRGELSDASKIRLRDAAGKEVPVQGKATAYWPERTIRFLCLDFLVDLKPNESQSFTLAYGSDVAQAAAALKVQAGENAATVETGAASFAFVAGEAFLTVKASANTYGPCTGKAVVAKDAAGKGPADHALVIDKVEVTEQGPVQATVHLTGHYGTQKTHWEKDYQGKPSAGKDEFRYPASLFVRVYAGATQAYVEHTFGYNGSEYTDFVQSYGIAIPTGLKGGAFHFGGDDAKASEQAALGTRLNQFAHDQWALSGKEAKSGKRIAGWAAVAGGGARVLAALREGWQNWPVAFASSEDGTLRVEFMGEKEGRALDLRYEEDGEPPLRKVENHSWYFGEQLTLYYSGNKGGEMNGRAAGIAKIHELLLDFAAEPAADVARAHQQPLYPWPGNKRYRETRALGHIAVYDDSKWDFAKEYFSVMYDAMPLMHEANGLYGFVNWGDLPMCDSPKGGKFNLMMDGGVGWSNGERALAPYFYHYAATGERRYLDMGRAMVHHTIGIDLEHYGGDTSPGNYHRHNQVHWRHRGLGSTRQGGYRGWHKYYWLTGDPQVGLDALRYGIDSHGQRSMLNLTGPDVTGGIGYDYQHTSVHFLALWCWVTAGEDRLARAFPHIVKLWKICGEQGKQSKQGWVFFKVENGEPAGYELAAEGPQGGYWLTYGGDDLCVEWAALTGDPNAVDAILLQGKMHGGPKLPNGCEAMYHSPESLYVAVAYLDPSHAELKRLLEKRLWMHPGLKRFQDQKWKAPASYASAEDWNKFGTYIYRKNGFSIHGAQCLEILYIIRALEVLDEKAKK
ncbi:MAG: hypothetical protein L6R28_03175 [Planctomycetes bacterium]|nr:hypothetical protein [Planctomycetota bacterium]